MGSPVLATGRVSGVTGNVPGPPEGSGGPPGGATSPGGPYGLYVERDQPLVGWAPSLPGHMRLGVWGNPKGMRPPCLGGQGNPPGRRPLLRLDLRGPAPLSLAPIYLWGWEGSRTQVLVQPSPSPKSSSSPTVLGKALQDYHAPPSPPRRRAAAGWSLPQPLLLPLLDQGVGDVTGLYVC